MKGRSVWHNSQVESWLHKTFCHISVSHSLQPQSNIKPPDKDIVVKFLNKSKRAAVLPRKRIPPHIKPTHYKTQSKIKHPEVIWVKKGVSKIPKKQEWKECMAKMKPGFVVTQYQGHSEQTLTTYLYPTHHNLTTQQFNTIRTFKQS